MKLKIKLPVWMNKGEPLKLTTAAMKYWERMYKWLQFPILQFDPLTCDERLLFLYAYQRDVKRLNNEPLALYRGRIKYAYVNAVDSGSVIGFKNIFIRLGVGYLDIFERQPNIDWDVIILRISDTQISKNHELLMEIIRQYGRTCRRYIFEIVHIAPAIVRSGNFSNLFNCQGASFKHNIIYKLSTNLESGDFSNQSLQNGARFELNIFYKLSTDLTGGGFSNRLLQNGVTFNE